MPFCFPVFRISAEWTLIAIPTFPAALLLPRFQQYWTLIAIAYLHRLLLSCLPDFSSIEPTCTPLLLSCFPDFSSINTTCTPCCSPASRISAVLNTNILPTSPAALILPRLQQYWTLIQCYLPAPPAALLLPGFQHYWTLIIYPHPYCDSSQNTGGSGSNPGLRE